MAEVQALSEAISKHIEHMRSAVQYAQAEADAARTPMVQPDASMQQAIAADGNAPRIRQLGTCQL